VPQPLATIDILSETKVPGLTLTLDREIAEGEKLTFDFCKPETSEFADDGDPLRA
jgi:hypothetical protein